MRVGVQFTGTVAANQTGRWFTHSWPQDWHVVWSVVPTTPRTGTGQPQIEWEVEVERSNSNLITYWLNIKNLTSESVNIEARYAILN